MRHFARAALWAIGVIALSIVGTYAALAQAVPKPLLGPNMPVDWWFAFKFNAAAAPGCGAAASRSCIFSGTVKSYSGPHSWSQKFVVASSANPTLTENPAAANNTCLGSTLQDPVGATFNQIYRGSLFYVIWNDQFYGEPPLFGCGTSCGAPWGHSKGALAWDKNGNGFVMQVTTPSWPGSAKSAFRRTVQGNTLGCIGDNDIEFSQHFFALALNAADVRLVLEALKNASVVTNPGKAQIVKNGGPQAIKDAVKALGHKVMDGRATIATLSSGAQLISKPSNLQVPAWQMVSAMLQGVPLRAATWWTSPSIPTTTTAATPQCWDASLGTPGPVAIATTGTWNGQPIGLKGGLAPDRNHAKVGVSVPASPTGPTYTIFGDMNQQGSLGPVTHAHFPNGWCGSSQNGRGGTWYVLNNPTLFRSVTALLTGETAPP